MNLYQYAFNSPTNYIDPWGLSSKEKAGLLETALKGDMLEGETNVHPVSRALIDTGIGLIPIVGQIADLRDSAAALRELYAHPGSLSSWRQATAAGLAWMPGLDGLKSGNRALAEGADEVLDEAARYQKYWDDLQGKAPVKSAPYSIRNKYTPEGELKSVTTYDKFGNRAYQYEVHPSVRHGEGYHIYDNTGINTERGKGPRSDHIDFD
jgi:hypothetical protein